MIRKILNFFLCVIIPIGRVRVNIFHIEKLHQTKGYEPFGAHPKKADSVQMGSCLKKQLYPLFTLSPVYGILTTTVRKVMRVRVKWPPVCYSSFSTVQVHMYGAVPTSTKIRYTVHILNIVGSTARLVIKGKLHVKQFKGDAPGQISRNFNY